MERLLGTCCYDVKAEIKCRSSSRLVEMKFQSSSPGDAGVNSLIAAPGDTGKFIWEGVSGVYHDKFK